MSKFQNFHMSLTEWKQKKSSFLNKKNYFTVGPIFFIKIYIIIMCFYVKFNIHSV